MALALAASLTLGTFAAAPDGTSRYKAFSPDGVPVRVTETPWDMDMHGNHRAVVTVSDNSEAVSVFLPWRRPDVRIDTKKIKVTDAQDNEIDDVLVLDMNSENGTVAFRPAAGPGTYYVYYLPCVFRRGHGGSGGNDYLPVEYKADAAWAQKAKDGAAGLPKAKLTAFESLTTFDFWSPMGLIATEAETSAIKDALEGDFAVFPEDRAFPIQLKKALPAKWAAGLPKPVFKGLALRDEYYVWQLGVWAAKKELKGVKVAFSDFRKGGAVIPASELTCFNQEGTSWDGSHMDIDVDVPEGNVQAMWCGVMIPADARPGIYKGTATVTAEGAAPQEIAVRIRVKGKTIEEHGDSETWRHSRLRWLNSTIAMDNEPTKEYDEMTLSGNVIGATGRTVEIGENGMPQTIEINGRQVFEKPLQFVVTTSKGDVAFSADNLKISKEAAGLVTWTASSEQEGISFKCDANMEFDGNMHYEISVSAPAAVEVRDIRLVSTYSAYASEYYMGCGTTGGYRPTDYSWTHDKTYDSYWIGGPLAGLHVEFRGAPYHGPLFQSYNLGPAPVWANAGLGKVTVKGAKGAASVVTATTGANVIGPEAKTFEFNMLITPVKTLNTAKHFSQKYFHADPSDFDKAAEEDGANIDNIHHARGLNPYINYPFIVREPLKEFIAHEHESGRKVKIYYTIRELTTHCEEVYAFRSLGHEIFDGGVGAGVPWYCEHMIDDYFPHWYTSLENFPEYLPDAALRLNGNSRFINYWLEGLRWMEEHYDLDGLYMDDVSFDRTTVKRLRKILEMYQDEPLIDLHSNTGYSIGPANQYTEFFPYMDRLWFGESFKYDRLAPDEWFVTFSGIPFGEMGEMLQDGGNRFLGMVYGATARHSWTDAGDRKSPVPVWKFWDKFGIADAKMVGYWDTGCPVSTSDPEVKATAYIKDDSVLISVGNFAASDKNVRLNIDWKALGFDPAKVRASLPRIENFQEETSLSISAPIPVKSKEGVLVLLSK